MSPDRCRRCILPASYPGISFDEAGICNHCRSEGDADDIAETRARLKSQTESVIDEVRGKAEYDCIVALSGGKDSSYTLWLLKEHYGLNPLAITIDNGFLSTTAVANCHALVEALGVDFTIFKPAFRFMRDMYRQSMDKEVHSKAAIKRASPICNSCIGLINNHMIKEAIRRGIPMIAGGYLGGQVPKDSAVLSLSLPTLKRFRQNSSAHYVEQFGSDAERFFGLPEIETAEFPHETLYVINPLLGEAYDEKQIVQKVSEYGWRRSNDTGRHSSNCRLNDVGILSHQKKYGFHPYEAELADLVRKGLMDRQDAIERIESSPDLESLRDVFDRLGVDPDTLAT